MKNHGRRSRYNSWFATLLSLAAVFLLPVAVSAREPTPALTLDADIRGCIYAAYTLAEELLGVDPWYFWVDKEPVARKSIEVPAGYDRRFGEPTFKYRGWFINDEDLLSAFSPDPLRENAFSLEMADRIYETLLRLRGNMIVPATFHLRSSLKGEHWIHRCLRRLEGKAHPLIAAKKDLDPEVLGMAKEWLQFSIENRKAMESLAEKAGKLKARIPASRQDFYQSHLLTQIQIHLQSFAALEATCRAVLAHGDHDQPMALQQTAEALAAGERLQDALRKAEYGKWAAWYAGERFIDLQRTRLTLQDLRAVLKGEPETPKSDLWEDTGRDPVHHYNHIYQYQEPFLKNYPLFHPPTQRPTR